MNQFFTADLHFDHGSVIKYNGRTQFMSPETKLELLKVAPKESGQWAKEDVRHIKIDRVSVERMNQGLIDNINSLVFPGDELYILGDLGFFKTSSRIVQLLKQLQCSKLLYVWGNHDDKDLCLDAFATLSKYYKVEILGDQVARKFGNHYVVLNHYPMARWDRSHRGSINLYGHCHGCYESHREQKARQMDVGVDRNDYFPVSFDQVLSKLREEGRL